MIALRVAVVLIGMVGTTAAWVESASASAVSVEQESSRYEGHVLDRLIVLAAPGESNDVTVTKDGSSVLVRDRVRIQPGPSCAAESATVVRCSITATVPTHLTVELGDGDDRVDAGDVRFARLGGGPGSDLLVSTRAAAYFRGGPGEDRMLGGPGSDYFFEGPADSGSDTMIGGSVGVGRPDWPGADVVDYSKRRTAVHADLEGDRDDGAAGEGDRIAADVEDLVGGSGPDELTGGPGRNSIDGGNGRDTVVGGPGRDWLIGDHYVIRVRRSEDRISGGPGADALQGGSGSDRIAAGPGRDAISSGPGGDRVMLRDGDSDIVACNAGRDVAVQDARDFLLSTCERHRRAHPPRAMPVLWADASDTLTLIMACPSGRRLRCEGTVTVDPGPPVPRATRSFSLAPGSLRYLYLPLAGRTYENRVPPLEPAVLELSSTDSRGRVGRRLVPLREVADDVMYPIGLEADRDPRLAHPLLRRAHAVPPVVEDRGA